MSLLVKSAFRMHLEAVAKKHRMERQMTSRKPKLMFGTTPIINNKYWSNALKEAGYDSTTIVYEYYNINKKSDYDLFFEDIIQQSAFKLKYFCSEYIVLKYILQNFDIVHIPFFGLSFDDKWIKDHQIDLLKKFGCKIVVLPYGADFYQYSKIPNLSWRHVLQANYPQAAIEEPVISKKIQALTAKADVIISGLQTEGLGRWDVFPYNIVSVNVDACIYNQHKYNNNNGKNGVVRIAHTPNHRYIKGTEYLLQAVKQLQSEGLLVELILMEKRPNDEVLKVLGTEVDVLVEQLVFGYALSAMEGMASGVPVLSNLSEEASTRAFRRYSYLNECPIVSTTPENITENLRILITNPDLRKTLGMASRKYVEKYHSNKTIQVVFSNVYDKIWYKKDVDLMNMFHPLNPNSYNNSMPKIEHPLIENKIPAHYFDETN